MRYQEFEEPMTKAQIEQKMLAMMETRRRQEAEAREKFGIFHKSAPQQVVEEPMTKAQIERKMLEMMEARNCQKEQFRKQYLQTKTPHPWPRSASEEENKEKKDAAELAQKRFYFSDRKPGDSEAQAGSDEAFKP